MVTWILLLALGNLQNGPMLRWGYCSPLSVCLSVCMTCSWCTWPQINSGKLVYLAGSDSLWSLSRLQTGPWATHTSHPTSTTNELEFNLKDLGRQSGSKGELGEE